MDIAPPPSDRPAPPAGRRIEIYDTTLRDGTQGAGVAVTLQDKLDITGILDGLGVDFIEGGYPLSNPKDEAYFAEAQKLELQHARVTAFGMTRRKATAAADDTGMQALINSGAPVVTIVGKTWDLHVDEVLRVDRDENVAMIRDSLACVAGAGHVEQVMYDAEHFFDGYRANPDYALRTLRAALDGGATRLVLCDTNGGSMPGFVGEATAALREALGLGDPADLTQPQIAIHTHNDCGLAIANAQAAIAAGAVQVQGTMNGIGERCGNCDLVPVIANLRLKLGHDCLTPDALPKLREVSRAIDAHVQLPPQPGQPYVGANAFTHKGGMHVHAVQRIAHSYEHVPPGWVGNQRRILNSELAGASNIVATLGDTFDLAGDKEKQRQLLEAVQNLEHQGYQFESVPASLELLAHRRFGSDRTFWKLDHYRCVILRRADEGSACEATVKLRVNGQIAHTVAEGDGPVNALVGAFRAALRPHYAAIDDLHLTDFAVRVVNPTAESAAKVRVTCAFDSKRGGTTHDFATQGVNENIIDASWQALSDAIQYHLMHVS